MYVVKNPGILAICVFIACGATSELQSEGSSLGVFIDRCTKNMECSGAPMSSDPLETWGCQEETRRNLCECVAAKILNSPEKIQRGLEIIDPNSKVPLHDENKKEFRTALDRCFREGILKFGED